MLVRLNERGVSIDSFDLFCQKVADEEQEEDRFYSDAQAACEREVAEAEVESVEEIAIGVYAYV